MTILQKTIARLRAAKRKSGKLRSLKTWTVWTNLGLAVMLLTISIPTAASAAVYAQASQPKNDSEEEEADSDKEGTFITHATGVIEVKLEPNYAETLESYAKQGYEWVEDVEVPIDIKNFTRFRGREPEILSELDGRTGDIINWQEETEWLEWRVTVPKTGLYNLELEYYPLAGKRASIQRRIQIDGEYPFQEARRLVFVRFWKDKGLPTTDNQGNDRRPGQREDPRWETVRIIDGDGMYPWPFDFYLTEGEHVIRLITVREPIAIRSLKLVPPSRPPTYAEVLQMYKEKGYKNAGETLIRHQAELPVERTEATIRMEYTSGPLVDPYSAGYVRLNAYGSYRWRRALQAATWEFEVPEDGLYKISWRRWQAYASFLPSARRILIDGKVPFQELNSFLFTPDNDRDWRIVTFGEKAGEGEPYLFYLTKGKHTLTMEVTVGPSAETIRAINKVVTDLSIMVREITMITGVNPDPYMEFDLTSRIPTLVPRLVTNYELLREQVEHMTMVNNGVKPNVANVLGEVAFQLEDMARDPESMSRRLSDLSASQGRLSQWLLYLREHPLWLDYLLVSNPEMDLGVGRASIFRKGWAGFMNFLSSFVRNYYGVGSIYGDDDNTITVWVARGREWGMIMKDMTEDDFTPASGIAVNLQVFPPAQLSAGSVNVLLLSVASGVTPDVATGVLPDVPVEFAIRNGVANMNKFLDYQEVTTRFRPGALLPFRWEGGDYAIPETQDFLMMFYRTDIFTELGLTPPDTWQDLYNMIWLLQQRGMDFFFPPVGVSAGGGIYGLAESLVPGFLPFLYQNGGDFYTDRGLSALDSPEALAGFREWTELYTNYKITQQADFYNRMRTGEMPIGVSGFFTYVLLSVAAPELEGRWEMLPLPGKRRPDGQVDRTSGGYGQAVVIMDNSEKQDKAWEWAKWWTSTRAQARFGEELEALIGTEARWNTANVKALNQLPFPQKDIEAIQEQWRWFKEQPVTLGGYFTPRHIINAWNRVVLQGWNAREALEEAVKQIDRELIRKREEFGLPVDLTKTKGGLE